MQNASTSEDPDSAALTWEIQITLRVLLSDNDVSSLEAPPPLYIQVPRQSYLFTVLPRIKPLWQHVLPPEVNGAHKPWFSFNSLPLKWNVSTGVLYDLLVPSHGSQPWHITLHFTGFPTSALGEYVGESSIRSTFRNSLKEASFIARKSAQPVLDMVMEAQNDHWKALGGNGSRTDYKRYRDIMHSIPLISPNSLDAVPIRVYLRPGNTGKYLSSYEIFSQSSRFAPVLASDGRPNTLGAALAPIIISWLIEHDAWENGKGLNRGEETGTVAATAASDDEEEKEKELEAAWAQVDVALSGGIKLQPSFILRDLHRDLHSPDFFLYVVLHMLPAHR